MGSDSPEEQEDTHLTARKKRGRVAPRYAALLQNGLEVNIAETGLLAESCHRTAPQILAAALDYHAWDLYVIPIKPGTQVPAVNGLIPYLTTLPMKSELRTDGASERHAVGR